MSRNSSPRWDQALSTSLHIDTHGHSLVLEDKKHSPKKLMSTSQSELEPFLDMLKQSRNTRRLPRSPVDQRLRFTQQVILMVTLLEYLSMRKKFSRTKNPVEVSTLQFLTSRPTKLSSRPPMIQWVTVELLKSC
jgi:hypothetical protein